MSDEPSEADPTGLEQFARFRQWFEAKRWSWSDDYLLQSQRTRALLYATWADMDDLRSLVYVPGDWKCPKCGMIVHYVTLTPDLMEAIDNADHQARCMNDCGPMARLTYKDDAEAANSCGQDLAKQVHHLTQRLFELEPNN